MAVKCITKPIIYNTQEVCTYKLSYCYYCIQSAHNLAKLFAITAHRVHIS